MPLTGVALHDLGLWNWGRDVVVRQIRDKACCRGRRCTRSVGIAPLLIGCSAT